MIAKLVDIVCKQPQISFDRPNVGRYQLIRRVISERLNDKVVVKADLVGGFMSVDHKLMAKVASKHAVPSWAQEKSFKNVKIVGGGGFRGLPQGMATSPSLFRLYLAHILKGCPDQFKVWVYVDDLFIIASNIREAKKGLRWVEKRFSKYGWAGQKLTFHRHGPKQPSIVAPWEELSLLGIDLEALTQIPTGECASQLVVDYKNLIKSSDIEGCQGGQLDSMRILLETVVPTTDWESTGDQLTSTQIHWDSIYTNRDVVVPKSTTERMALFRHPSLKSEKGGGVVGDSISSSFAKDQISARKKIYQKLKFNSEKFVSNWNLQSLGDKSAFFRCVEELEAYYIFFAPYDTFTGTFWNFSRNHIPKGASYTSALAEALYMNELRLINSIGKVKKPPKGIFMSIDRQKQLLRGAVTKKYLDLIFARKLKFDPSTIKTLGTIVWPINEIFTIGHIVKAINSGELNHDQFRKAIKLISEKMREGEQFLADSIISDAKL
jgi:hypothetical protein